jgi:hypothetical protein
VTDTASTGQFTDVIRVLIRWYAGNARLHQHGDALRGCHVWARRTRHTVVRGDVFA